MDLLLQVFSAFPNLKHRISIEGPLNSGSISISDIGTNIREVRRLEKRLCFEIRCLGIVPEIYGWKELGGEDGSAEGLGNAARDLHRVSRRRCLHLTTGQRQRNFNVSYCRGQFQFLRNNNRGKRDEGETRLVPTTTDGSTLLLL